MGKIKRTCQAIKKNLENKDQSCRKNKGTTLLHWGIDSRKILDKKRKEKRSDWMLLSCF